MRKNTSDVINAWKSHERCRKCQSIWTDGETIYSYGTALLERTAEGFTFNATKYSVTTTIHQHAIMALLPELENVRLVAGVGRGRTVLTY